MVETQKSPEMIHALKQLNILHEKASKKVLSDEEMNEAKNSYEVIDQFIKGIERDVRKKITPQNLQTSGLPKLHSASLQQLKEHESVLSNYLRKSEKKISKRNEAAKNIYTTHLHTFQIVQKEREVREKTGGKIEAVIGIQRDEFYEKYLPKRLELKQIQQQKQEKNKLKENIKKNYANLTKKRTSSFDTIQAFHDNLLSYIDQSDLRPKKSFYDLSDSKTVSKRGLSNIKNIYSQQFDDSNKLFYASKLPKVRELRKEKNKLNSFLEKRVKLGINHKSILSKLAEKREEIGIQKSLAKLEKELGINLNKIYKGIYFTENKDVAYLSKELNELRDKFRPLDSPHLSKYENILIKKVLDDVEQRTDPIKLESGLDHIYATIEPRDERQSDTASRVILESSVSDTPIASSSEKAHAKAAPAAPAVSAAFIPPPPPMPPERPIEAINAAAIKKETPSQLSQNGAHSDKEESLYTEVDHSSKINRSSEAENQAAMRKTNLKTVNPGLDMNELKAALVARKNKNQQEENNHNQLIQNQNPETKRSIAALTGTPSKTPPPPPPRNREKQQSVETLKALASSQSKNPVNPDSMKNKIKYFEQNLRFQ